jgi:hypothetical protein
VAPHAGPGFGPPLFIAGVQTDGRDASAARLDMRSSASSSVSVSTEAGAAQVAPANLWQAMREKRGV